jgi:hypothetical protein
VGKHSTSGISGQTAGKFYYTGVKGRNLFLEHKKAASGLSVGNRKM